MATAEQPLSVRIPIHITNTICRLAFSTSNTLHNIQHKLYTLSIQSMTSATCITQSIPSTTSCMRPMPLHPETFCCWKSDRPGLLRKRYVHRHESARCSYVKAWEKGVYTAVDTIHYRENFSQNELGLVGVLLGVPDCFVWLRECGAVTDLMRSSNHCG
jgi:hypothetical protein